LSARLLADSGGDRQQRNDGDRKEKISHPAFYRLRPADATGRI
jgi:hypothetical protein